MTKAHYLLGIFVFVLTSSTGKAFSRVARFPLIQQRKEILKAAKDLVIETSPPDVLKRYAATPNATEKASICVIGGGVSGLAAAITAAEETNGKAKVLLIEASEKLGGRVGSDFTKDGFILDRGFAVFIEEYPLAKELLDYDQLCLGNFMPGALVKIEDNDNLVRVSDPLRNPTDIFTALFAPIGTVKDKIKLVPLILNVRRKSIEALFEEPETDTLTALKERWGFSEQILNKFFRPFFEGIFLAPLENQSSRMFSFVFKMFSEGSATLPLGGMAAVSKQLEANALESGVDVLVNCAVSQLRQREGGGFLIDTNEGKTCFEADSVVVATDVAVAQTLLSRVAKIEVIEPDIKIAQRSVGCLYYSFEGEAPVSDPILILNGEGKNRGTLESPINNVCFPSSVHANFAPQGSGLCSVCILGGTIDAYKGNEEELDQAVREQLGSWFPDFQDAIRSSWQLKQIYYIPNAQPLQVGAFAATVNGGRDCTEFRGEKLPSQLYVCGDHMATSSLNGALESGVNAGKASGQAVAARISAI